MASFLPEAALLAVVAFKMGEVVDKTFWVEVGNCCRSDVDDWNDAILSRVMIS